MFIVMDSQLDKHCPVFLEKSAHLDAVGWREELERRLAVR